MMNDISLFTFTCTQFSKALLDANDALYLLVAMVSHSIRAPFKVVFLLTGALISE